MSNFEYVIKIMEVNLITKLEIQIQCIILAVRFKDATLLLMPILL